MVGIFILALAVPAIPGIDGLAPGDGRSVRTQDGSASFISAPSCSETRADLCLDASEDPEPRELALSRAARSPSTNASTGEADANLRLRAPEPTPTPEPTSAPEPWGAMEIRPGDTLIALANWFGVSPFDIAVMNGAAVDDYLIIGRTLLVPVPESQFVMPPVPDLSVPAEEPAAVTPQPEPDPPPVVVAPPELEPQPSPPPASSGPWTKEEVVEAICSLPWPCETMVAIAACESGLRPDAFNPIGYYGIFQINYAFEGWDNPWTNAQVAYYEKYLPMLNWSGDGLAPWPVCRYY
ncbi:MAG TPA: LysM peptidoglycan-binding domain-containing protein [Dehalococcoidia bacterium]